MNKVCMTLGPSSFAIVWRWRGPRPQYLSRYVLTGCRFRQARGESNNTNRRINQPILEFIRSRLTALDDFIFFHDIHLPFNSSINDEMTIDRWKMENLLFSSWRALIYKRLPRGIVAFARVYVAFFLDAKHFHANRAEFSIARFVCGIVTQAVLRADVGSDASKSRARLLQICSREISRA